MTAPDAPKQGAVEYAEKTLGVHDAWEAASEAHSDLVAALDGQMSLRRQKREWEQAIADREMELSISEHGKHPEMSVAAMDRHLKPVYFKDEFLRNARKTLSDVLSDLDTADANVKLAEVDARSAAARMQELGGYLQYLAAVRSSGKAREATTPEGDHA